MAVEVGQAVIPVSADFGQFQKQLQSGLAGASSKMQSVGKSMFRSGAVITAGFTAPVVAGFKSTIDAASDLNETVSKARTIFGPAAGEIEKWAGTAASSFGQSKQQALDAAGTFGNLFVQLGIGSGEAANMSRAMVELSSDFASFHNADITEVVNAQQAAFRGEYDALQRFVPTINAAAVEQEALAMTGKKATKELTLQEKALATQQLMMKGAGDATGDFARTSDGAANKQRILSAQFANASATLGNQLLPHATALLGWVQQAVTWFANLGQPMQGIILAGVGLLAAIGPLVAIFGALATAVGVLISPVALIVIGIAALAAGVIYAYQHFEGFREVVAAVVSVVSAAVSVFVSYIAEQFGNLVEWTRQHWDAISEAIGHVLAVIQAIIGAAVDAISAAWQLFGDNLLNIAKAMWDFIKQTIEYVLSLIRGTISTVLALINGDWGEAWDAIKGMVSAAWDQIKNVVSTALGLVGELVRMGMDAVKAGFGAAWDGIKAATSGAVDAVVGFVRAVPGKLLGFAGDMLGAGAGLGGKFLDGLKRGLTAAAGFAGDIASGIVNVVKGAWNTVAGMINAFVPNSIGWGPFSLDLPDNPIPTFHAGGMYRAPMAGGEGLALLRDRELVTTPENQAAMLHKLDVLISRVDRLTDTQITLARTM